MSDSGYSFYEFEGDGVTTQYPIQFSLGELKRAYVTCQVNNEVDGEGDPVYRELVDVPGDPGMVEIQGAVPADGAPIVFRRVVPKELLLHLYANGSILDYPSLDESHLQLMMALHEVLDGFGLTNVFTDINMHGNKLTNVYSDPDDPDSLATVEFLGTYRQDALNAAAAAEGFADDADASATTAGNSATAAAGFAADAETAELQSAGHAQDASDSAAAALAAAESIGPPTKEQIEAVLIGEIDSHSHAAATLPSASETVVGIVELATITEAETGTDTDRAVTPAGVAAAIAAQSSAGYQHVAGSSIYFAAETEAPCVAETSYNTIPTWGDVRSTIRISDFVFSQITSHQDRCFKVDHPGQVTVTFEMARAAASGTAYARICKSGVALEEWSQTSESYVVRSKTIDVLVGDIITIQRKSSSSSVATTKTRYHRVCVTRPS